MTACSLCRLVSGVSTVLCREQVFSGCVPSAKYSRYVSGQPFSFARRWLSLHMETETTESGCGNAAIERSVWTRVHDGAPERFLIAVCEGGECTVIVVSAPDGARIIRGAACKPDVAVVRRWCRSFRRRADRQRRRFHKQFRMGQKRRCTAHR